MATPLSSLPELLRSFSMLEKYEIKKNNDPASLSENDDDNDLSSSVDLKEIESIGMKKFHKHIFPKLSSPINQINQYHKIPCRKELQFSSSNNEVMKNKAVLDNQMLDSLSSTPTFSPFSIKFNECSLFAISHWAVKSSIPNDSEAIRDEVTRQYYPAPDVKLRKCNICNRWGHYDIECGKMAKADVFYFSNALQNQSTKPLAYNKHSRDKQTINLKEPCVDSTNVDSCGKFFLEQSKNMLPIDSGYLNYVNDSESCNGSELVEVRLTCNDLPLFYVIIFCMTLNLLFNRHRVVLIILIYLKIKTHCLQIIFVGRREAMRLLVVWERTNGGQG